MARAEIVCELPFAAEFFTNVEKELEELGGTKEDVYEWMKTESEGARWLAQKIFSDKKSASKRLILKQQGISIVSETFHKSSFFSIFGFADLRYWKNFIDLVMSEIPEVIPAFTGTLSKYCLTEKMNDIEIQGRLRNFEPFTVCEFATIIRDLVLRQLDGVSGILLNNGRANIFYVKLSDGTVVALLIYWSGKNHWWSFDVRDLDSKPWYNNVRVFSRN